MIIFKQTLIRFTTRLIEMMPTYIDFHKKTISIASVFVAKIDNCDHNMIIADDNSYCANCGANYYEAIEYKYERKEFLVSRDILNGKYNGRLERFFK